MSDQDPDIELVYFKARFKAETSRLILVAAGIKFKDNQDPNPDTYKAESPFGQLPYIVYNGLKAAQSTAIATFLARKYGYYSNDDVECLRIDEILCLSGDVKEIIRKWYFADDQGKVEWAKDATANVFPQYLPYFETRLKENGATGFYAGESVTVADFEVYDLLDTFLGFDPKALDKGDYSSLKKLRENVEALPRIKEYLATRKFATI